MKPCQFDAREYSTQATSVLTLVSLKPTTSHTQAKTYTIVPLRLNMKGYLAIEIESLAVAWAMETFHHFLYANHFILETNQKLLEATLSKSLNQATPKLQRILIRTFPYHFSVCYIPGVTSQLADCLSRLEVRNIQLNYPNSMCTRSLTNYLQKVTV